MGRRGYPPEFRRPVLDLLAVGRRVTDLARNLGVSDQFGLGFTDPPLGCRELRPSADPFLSGTEARAP